MQISKLPMGRLIAIAAALVLVLGVSSVIAFEPLTRNVVAKDQLCTYCHLEDEYVPTARLSWSRPMKAAPESDKYARCVDCHVPRGFMGSVYAYLHFASVTDFFGYFRDRDTERSGRYETPRAITAYRVRDRLFQYNSVTCRDCHDGFEIDPKNDAATAAHEAATKESRTCIECHYNLVHRKVDTREDAFKRAKPKES